MRFFIQTLGCKINQYESQSLRESWAERGFEEAECPSGADFILVHTCAVTAGAVAGSRGAVRRAGREAPRARIIVTGCAAQTEPDVFRALPGVEAVVPRQSKPDLASWPEIPPSRAEAAWPAFSITRFHRARPILKIQDGCSHGCTYCIVPRARGKARSRFFPEILAEARALLASGHREIILSGINLGQFHMGEQGGFWAMLSRLESELQPEWGGRARIRLSSLDPGMLGAEALEVLGGSRMVCPHLHVSLQSADPGVLEAMGRGHYRPEDVAGFLAALRAHWQVMAVGADLLTGFPGESREAFERTLQFCGQAGLTYAHVFPFSRRPGTVAARIPGQLSREEKKERAALLRACAEALEAAFLDRVAALPELTVAVEKSDPGAGASEYYVECRLQGPSPVAPGGLLRARPAGVSDGVVLAEPLRD